MRRGAILSSPFMPSAFFDLLSNYYYAPRSVVTIARLQSQSNQRRPLFSVFLHVRNVQDGALRSRGGAANVMGCCAAKEDFNDTFSLEDAELGASICAAKDDFKHTFSYEDVELGAGIGSGNFSEVFRATQKKKDSDLDLLAVKVIWKSKLVAPEEKEAGEMTIGDVKDEIAMMSKIAMIAHENIVRLFGFHEDCLKFYIAMELLERDLMQLVLERGFLKESDAAAALKQTMSAIAHVHENSIVHRDMKIDNVMVKSSEPLTISIVDFGFAKLCERGEKCTTMLGTPLYVAPEIWRNEPYDQRVDVWSVGIIGHVLLCGLPPFFDPGEDQLEHMVCCNDVSFEQEQWSVASDDAKHFVLQMLVKEPQERPSAKKLLEHRWLRNAHELESSEWSAHAAIIPAVRKEVYLL